MFPKVDYLPVVRQMIVLHKLHWFAAKSANLSLGDLTRGASNCLHTTVTKSLYILHDLVYQQYQLTA